ncbi:hypothetical protein [Alteromonas macleodii]|uniref:Uncharacterized protein n=1 Tax=Alteromonas macleodii TaxID=28108 RepID=A0AB36FL74_ALTMA|nr:hypothetical protein [Alteromonas macleodii]OES24173.1 hypothetical protein BFV93_4773 [Alteromonas macleodii]OES24807.1 hypothetical protein BFV95_4566 [Alteromonas macleodii]OES25085.1 hypothetical protein BFV94_4556 [Alteromonas macleodii]OES39128.1 hypothetical protein BFV96_4276 [Alteromonas macleodii]
MTMNSQSELSDKALTSRLMSETTNHPVTLSTAVIGILGGAGSALFASSEVFMVLLGIAGLSGAACVAFVLNKTMWGKHRAMLAIIEKVRLETIEEREKTALAVKDDLTTFADQDSLKQLTQLKTKFAAFENVLDRQFDRDELSHKRYLTTAEQLYFSAVDNLKSVTLVWHSSSAIDPDHLRRQLDDETVTGEVRESLQQRFDLYQQAQEKRTDLLDTNEHCMTKLDELTSRLGAIQTREGLAEVRIGTVMNEMKELIQRTDKYDIRNQ